MPVSVFFLSLLIETCKSAGKAYWNVENCYGVCWLKRCFSEGLLEEMMIWQCSKLFALLFYTRWRIYHPPWYKTKTKISTKKEQVCTKFNEIYIFPAIQGQYLIKIEFSHFICSVKWEATKFIAWVYFSVHILSSSEKEGWNYSELGGSARCSKSWRYISVMLQSYVITSSVASQMLI